MALSGAVPAAGGATITAALTAKAALVAFLVTAAATGVWVIHQTRHSQDTPTRTVSTQTETPPKSSIDSTSAPGTPNGAGPSAAAAVAANAGAAPDTETPQPGTISGRVYDKDTGKGIAGIVLSVSPEGGGPYLGSSEPTKADGRYQIPPIEKDGTYSVTMRSIPAYPDLGGTYRASVTLKDGEPATDVDFALTKGLTVSGRVVDLRGKAVAKAEVGATTEGNPNPIRTKTDSEGAFTLYMPGPTDSLMVQARTDAFESLPQADLRLRQAGHDSLVLTLDQPKTASISGTVVDANGQPMNKARISLRRKSPGVFMFGADDRTDKTGAFIIKALPACEYAVNVYPASATSFSTGGDYANVALQEGEALTGLDIVYGERGGLAITGLIVDSSGKPISGAWIRCHSVEGASDHSRENGFFQLTGFGEGDYSLFVEHHHYSRTWLTLAAGVEDARIVLKGQGSMEGRVLRADTGEPLTRFNRAIIYGEVHDAASAPVSWAKPTESPDGTFAMGKLHAGALVIAVSAPGFGFAYQNITIEENTATQVEFRLEPVPPFEGFVVNEQGEAIAGANVFFSKVMSQAGLERNPPARTNEDGRFILDVLSPELKRLAAYHQDYGVGLIDVSDTNRIVLPTPGSLEGIVSAVGFRPNDMAVTIHYPEGHGLIPSSFQNAGSDGSFAWRKLTPGRVTVSARPRTADYPRRTVSETVLVESGQTARVTLALEMGTAVVEGRLVADGQPVPKAYVAIEQRDGDRVLKHGMATKPDGIFRFDQVCSGTWLLKVTRYDPDRPSELYKEELDIQVGDGETVHQEIEVATLR